MHSSGPSATKRHFASIDRPSRIVIKQYLRSVLRCGFGAMGCSLYQTRTFRVWLSRVSGKCAPAVKAVHANVENKERRQRWHLFVTSPFRNSFLAKAGGDPGLLLAASAQSMRLFRRRLRCSLAWRLALLHLLLLSGILLLDLLCLLSVALLHLLFLRVVVVFCGRLLLLKFLVILRLLGS